MSGLRRALSVFLSATLVVAAFPSSVILSTFISPPANAQLSDSELLPMNPMQMRPADQLRFNDGGKAPNLDKLERKTRLEDVFKRRMLNVVPADPVDLSNVKIPGLLPKNVSLLANNSFVVVNDTNIARLSDAYRENREGGKANFVTVDSFLHPYFGFANGLLGSAIEETIYAELMRLLVGMLQSSMADYRNTVDDEVKDDVQRNLAYISLALKLLEPKVKLPDIGGAIDLVDEDYQTVMSFKPGHSVICNLDEDFSYFRPWGWMDSSERLRRFFRAYQWLSRMYFPLSDITNNSVAGGGNSFRRAVLLYRSLVLAKSPDAESSLVHWNRIATVLALTGLDEPSRKKSLIPPELAPILKTSGSDLAGLLRTLEQPFLRTKLMLSIRKQRPVELGATSIFEVGKGSSDAKEISVVRLFPVVQPPEMPWIKEHSKDYVEVNGPQPVPLSLLVMHARGAAQATNVLSDLVQYLDSRLLTSVPRLERTLDRKNKLVVAQPDRHWDIVWPLFEPCVDNLQRVVRSEAWLTRQLETAICAWIDSYLAYNPIPREIPSGAAGGGTPAASDAGGAEGATDVFDKPGAAGGVTAPSPKQFPPPQPPSSRPRQLAQQPAGQDIFTKQLSQAAQSSDQRPASTQLKGAPPAPVEQTFEQATGQVDGKLQGQTAPAGTPQSSAIRQAPAAAPQGQAAQKTPAQAPSPPPNSPEGRAAAARTRPVQFQYLEPRPQIYKNVANDLKSISYQLSALNCFPPRYSQRTEDFIRLFNRLAEISEREIAGEPMKPADFSLLANIDQILSPVDNPIAGTIYFAGTNAPTSSAAGSTEGAGTTASPGITTNGSSSGTSVPGVITLQSQPNQPAAPISAQNLVDNSVFEKAVGDAQSKPAGLPQINTILPQRGGATFGIGRAGRLYVVCQSARGPILARGSVYTFYEVAGGPIKKEHWDRKLSYNLLRPPYWASRFDLVQDLNAQNSNMR